MNAKTAKLITKLSETTRASKRLLKKQYNRTPKTRRFALKQAFRIQIYEYHSGNPSAANQGKTEGNQQLVDAIVSNRRD